MKDATSGELLERLCQATKTSSDAALATALGLSHQAVYSAKSKQKIPTSWVYEAAKRFEVSADWIFFERGPMRPGEAASTASQLAQGSPPALTPQAPPATLENACVRCAKLEADLELERHERRDFTAEMRQISAEIRQLTEGVRQTATQNHELTSENRNLWKENGDLREKCARFEERQYQRTSQNDSEAVGSA